MAFIDSSKIDSLVKASVAKNWPGMASRGFINVPLDKQTVMGRVIDGREGREAGSALLFVNGVSRIGGKRVVGR